MYLGSETYEEGARLLLLRFSECRNIRLRDVTLRNSAFWVQHYLACDDVAIDGITVASRVIQNNDGIDIDDCSNVRVMNCNIWSGDDSVCLKSASGRGCRNIVVFHFNHPPRSFRRRPFNTRSVQVPNG